MPPPKTTNVDTASGSFGKRNRGGSAAKAPVGTGSFSSALRGSLNFDSSLGVGQGSSMRSTRGVPMRQVSTVELGDGSTIAMDLNIVLSNEKYYGYMMKHQEAEYTSENLIFWKAVDKLKRQKDFSKESTLLLYNTYIKNGVDMQVNISQGEREKIEAALGEHLAETPVVPEEPSSPKEISSTIFNVAQNEVYRMLKGDLYPRFKESAQFKEMLRREFNCGTDEPSKKKRTSIVEILTGSGNNINLSTEKPKQTSGACQIM